MRDAQVNQVLNARLPRNAYRLETRSKIDLNELLCFRWTRMRYPDQLNKGVRSSYSIRVRVAVQSVTYNGAASVRQFRSRSFPHQGQYIVSLLLKDRYQSIADVACPARHKYPTSITHSSR